MTTTPGQPTDPADLPADARLWRERVAAGTPTPWDELGFTWFADGSVPGTLDHSYLTPDDLAKPDIAANVKAIDETATLITWLLETEDGKAIGYWRGPAGLPLAEAPLVEFDTEGQFYLVGAPAITDYLANESAEYDDNWDEVVEACREAGITAELRDIYDWKNPEVAVDPRDFHEQRYQAYLAGPTA